MRQIIHRTDEDIPPAIRRRDLAKAYFGCTNGIIAPLCAEKCDPAEVGTAAAIAIDDIITSLRIVNWTSNTDIQNRMRIRIEDVLYELNFMFGSSEIAFMLTRNQRRTVRIVVLPDRKVFVEAPADHPLEEILKRVHQRAVWIIRQFEHFRHFRPLPTPRRFVSGETHLYLGKQYRLRVIRADRHDVKLIRGYFQVYIRGLKDTSTVEHLLQQWFSTHVRALLTLRLKLCHSSLKHHDIPMPNWCSSDGWKNAGAVAQRPV